MSVFFRLSPLVLLSGAVDPRPDCVAYESASDHEATTTSLLQVQYELNRNKLVPPPHTQASDPKNEARIPFSIAMLPDTQHYPEIIPAMFYNQTQWLYEEILLHNNSANFVLLTHVGDIVEHGTNMTQWDKASRAISVLRNLDVALSILPGDHDFDTDPILGHDFQKKHLKEFGYQNYLRYFNPEKYVGAHWFGAADPSGLNTFQYFSGGGFDFLHLALEYAPEVNLPEREPAPLQWAEQVLRSNPRVPTIITTHEYLTGVSSGQGRTGSGQAIWDILVRRHNQVVMVLCGHDHYGLGAQNGQYHQISTNEFGNSVIEVLSNFQEWRTKSVPCKVCDQSVFTIGAGGGANHPSESTADCVTECVYVEVPPHLHLELETDTGVGLLRLITFDLSVGQVRFQTYSPWLNGSVREKVERAGQRVIDFTLPLPASRLLAL